MTWSFILKYIFKIKLCARSIADTYECLKNKNSCILNLEFANKSCCRRFFTVNFENDLYGKCEIRNYIRDLFERKYWACRFVSISSAQWQVATRAKQHVSHNSPMYNRSLFCPKFDLQLFRYITALRSTVMSRCPSAMALLNKSVYMEYMAWLILSYYTDFDRFVLLDRWLRHRPKKLIG